MHSKNKGLVVFSFSHKNNKANVLRNPTSRQIDLSSNLILHNPLSNDLSRKQSLNLPKYVIQIRGVPLYRTLKKIIHKVNWIINVTSILSDPFILNIMRGFKNCTTPISWLTYSISQKKIPLLQAKSHFKHY